MNYYAFSAMVVCVSSVLSGVLVFWKNPQGRKNLVFLLVCGAIAFWSFFYIFWQLSSNESDALLFIRLCIVGGASIPVTNFHVVLKILDLQTPRRVMFLRIFYAVTIFLLLFSPTPYFIERVEPRGGFSYWPVPGWVMHLHFLNFCIPSIWVLYLIREKEMKSSPVARNKLKWMMASMLIGYIGACTNNFLWYNIPIKPFLNIFSSVGVVGVAFTFFRPSVVDFNFFFRKFFSAILYLVLCILAVWGCLLPFESYLRFVIGVSLASVLGIIFYPFSKKIVNWFSENILKNMLPSEKLIKAGEERIKESTYTYADLARNVIDLAVGSLPIDMSAVYFYDMNKNNYYLCAQKGMKNPLVQNLRYNRSALALPLTNPLIPYIETHQDLVILDPLLNDMEDLHVQPLIEAMTSIEAKICAPFVFGGKVRGFMVLGRKKDNTLFNEDEIEIIQSYAQIGSDVMRTIMAMETELNQNALYSHDMNHDIRSLIQTLQFIQSPLAKNQAADKLGKILKQAEDVALGLQESFEVTRDRSALIVKTIRGEYEKSPVKIDDALRLSAGKFSLQAEKGGIAYSVDVQETESLVLGNELDLVRVFDNLISNALEHLPSNGGSLSVAGMASGTGYEIRIKDNGEGIDPQFLTQIWQLGWQAPGSKKGSAGFGLAIVKQIVQIHGGTIVAESQGAGTGVEFKIFIPWMKTESPQK